MKILLVENHREFAAVVVPTFLAEHEVTIVASCSAARAAVTNDTFDVALVDYDLDDAKGDTFVRWLAPKRTPPVVAISSHEAGNAALLSAGAVAACPKIHFDQIATVLARVRAAVP
jgi:DNA-binding response OmpR family regulator